MQRPVADFSSIRSAFSNRNYAVYAAGNAVSLTGHWVQRLAVGWLAWELTGSGFWLGAVAFADLAPVFFVGPPAGVMADRLDRRRIAIICQALAMLQALLLFAMTVTGAATIELLFGLTLVAGVVVAVNQPARLSLVPSLVRPRDLAAAVAISSVIFNLARFVGPAIAGVIITTLGVAPAFAFNAVTYLVFIVALASLRTARRTGGPRSADGMTAEIVEGVRYAATHAAIAPLLALTVALSILARPVFELLPGFADAVFGRGAGGLAVLTSSVGFGAVAGGLWLAQRGTVKGLTTITLATGVLSGIVVMLFAATDVFAVGVGAMAIAGFTMVVFGIASQTLIQMRVDERMRGRVMSLWGLIIRGAPAVGALVLGWLSGFGGFGWPVFVGGVLSALAGLLAARRRRRLRTLLE